MGYVTDAAGSRFGWPLLFYILYVASLETEPQPVEFFSDNIDNKRGDGIDKFIP